MSRYSVVADRPDLLHCSDCSTRTLVVLVPADEKADHDTIHSTWDETGQIDQQHQVSALTDMPLTVKVSRR